MYYNELHKLIDDYCVNSLKISTVIFKIFEPGSEIAEEGSQKFWGFCWKNRRWGHVKIPDFYLEYLKIVYSKFYSNCYMLPGPQGDGPISRRTSKNLEFAP